MAPALIEVLESRDAGGVSLKTSDIAVHIQETDDESEQMAMTAKMHYAGERMTAVNVVSSSANSISSHLSDFSVSADPASSQASDDFARFDGQSEALHGYNKADETLQFWTTYLRDCPDSDFPGTPNPLYHPQPQSRTGVRVMSFEPDAEHQTSLATYAAAAWGLVLARYSSLASDVVFGFSKHQSMSTDTATEPNQPGMVLPIRIALHSGTTVSTYLKNVDEIQAAILEHSSIGEAAIARCSPGATSAWSLRTAVFINPVTDIVDRDSSENARSDPLDDRRDIALALVAHNATGTALEFCGRYDKSLVNPEQAERFIHQFAYIFGQLVRPESTDHKLADLDICCPEDMQQIASWSPAVPDVHRACLHTMVRQTSVRLADELAIDSWDGSMSYRELEDASDKLARHLKNLGIGPGSHVPLAFDRSRLVPITQLAILKAGAAYIGIDPSHPSNRLQKIFDAAEARYIAASPRWATKFRSCVENVIEVSQQLLDGITTGECKLPEVSPEDTAVIIFTSGSTGTPKGIVMRHRDFATAIIAHSDGMKIPERSRVLQFSSFTFDHSMYEILTTLVGGGVICIPTEEQRTNDLAGVMRQLKINFLYATPTVAKLLTPSEVPDLQTLYLGGEAISQTLLNEWLATKRVIAGYGPTEAGMCGYGQFARGDSSNTIHTSQGGVMWLVDPENYHRLAPVGTVGELLAEGPMIAKGYLNDPKKTAEGFVSTPKWRKLFNEPRDPDSMRFYKTGDYAQYNPDGTFKFIGRIDTQVKVRGNRIELEDVEDQIKACVPAGTGFCVDVVHLQDASSSASLAAFFTLADASASLDTEDTLASSDEDITRVRAILKDLDSMLMETLPVYMVPTVYIAVSSRFPMTSSGKLDRKRLRTFASRLRSSDLVQFMAPTEAAPVTTDMERKLKALWERVLRTDNPDTIDAASNFFRLGGDSIASMRLVSAARAVKIAITVSEILNNPVLANMARVAQLTEGETLTTVAPFSLLGSGVEAARTAAALKCGVKAESLQDIMPCTPLQEGLMALSIRDQGTYVLQKVYPLPDTIDAERFIHAWNTVSRHSARCLRTRVFENDQMQLLQTIVEEDLEWKFPDLGLDEYLRKDMQEEMTLNGRLARFAILESADQGPLFVLTIHHAIHDAWSLDLMLTEVTSVYAGNRPIDATSFSGFLQHLQGLDDATMKEGWNSQLEDAPLTRFPAAPIGHSPRPQAFLTREFALPHQHKSSSQYSPAIKARAAWAVLLSIYVDSDDVVFLNVSNGRGAPVENIESIMAPTLATVPNRVQINKERPLGSLFQNLQVQTAKLIELEQYGLQNIQQLSEDGRTACEAQTLFLVEVDQDNAQDRDLLVLKERKVQSDVAFHNFAFGLKCDISTTQISLTANWDSQLLSESQVQQMLYQLQHLIERFFSVNPNILIDEIDLVCHEDVLAISQWNSTGPRKEETCLHELFKLTALKYPDSIALTAWDGEMTYQQLDMQSTILAGHILSLRDNFAPGDMIVLSFEKSVWTIAAVLAVMKAGGASVILDPTLPQSRRENFLRQVSPRLALASVQQTHLFEADENLHVLTLDSAFMDNLPRNHGLDLPRCSPSSTALITFTSGSTGEPKGVVISHRAACSSILAMCSILGTDNQSRIIQFAPYAFDAFYGEVFAILCTGGCLCIITDDDRSNRLSDFMRESEINCAFLTPTVGAQLNPKDLPHLKLLAMGGERMTDDCVRTWGDHINLVNVYGPAETTIMCSANSGFTLKDSLSNVGRAVGARLWITQKGDANTLVPVGVVGEILAEGPSLSTGYFNNDEKTAENFVYNPKWSVSGPLSGLFAGIERRFYRTGDMARYNPDGTFEIMGREDSQLKIRGLRVELGEVEFQLRRHLPYHEIAAEGVRLSDTSNEMAIVAFVANITNESDQGQAPTIVTSPEQRAKLVAMTEGLQNKLALSLPSYMIPSIMLPITKMPHTGTSKLDRKRLRQMAAELSRESLLTFHRDHSDKRAASTEVEKMLLSLWADVLKLPAERISADDSFFRVGGDSITAMKVVGKARGLGYPLKIQQMFRHPILSDLAQSLEIAEAVEEHELRPFELVQALGQSVESTLDQAASACNIVRADIVDIYPNTPLQDALVALSAKNPGTYVAQLAVALPDTIDINSWCKAWEQVCERSPMFRSHFFHTASGRLMQAVARFTPQWRDGADLEDYLSRDRSNPMTIGQSLCRYAIVQDPAAEKPTYFVLSLHRSAYDAWSLLRLFEDIEKVYLGGQMGDDQIIGFNAFSQFFLRMDNAEFGSFWNQQMTNAPTMSYPRLPDISYQPAASSQYQYTVKTAPNNNSDYTTSTLIRAAWALLLARYSDDTDDVVFGASLNGRSADVRGVTSIIGPTTAVVPIRIKMDKANQDVDTFLAQVQNQATEMMSFEQYGIYNISRLSEEIKEACNFQTLLMIQTESESSSAATGGALGLKLIDANEGPFHTFAMSLEAVIGSDSIDLTIEYDPEIFEVVEIHRLAAHLEQLMNQLQDPEKLDQKLSSLDFLSALDIAQLTSWNPAPPNLQSTFVHTLFEESVKKHPDAPAVCSWEGEFSYAEVNEMASAMVGDLITRGVRPGSLVPLVFEKSVFTIITMLGVLKAGGAFVALDPSHPLERLQGLVQDVSGDLVIASQQFAAKASLLSTNLLVVDGSTIATANKAPTTDLPTTESRPLTPLDPFCILFTSGSTGKPKAINITHSSFASSIRGHSEVLCYGAQGSRNLQFTAYTSDVSMGEIFTSLAVGACVCVPSDGERMNGLAGAMERMRVNWAFLTPSVASLLHPKDVPALKTLLFGGETATPHNVSTWAPAVNLINSFGPAETCIWSHCNPGISPDDSGRNIGFGIGCNTWITDPNDYNKLAPIGTIGELIVEGPNVADGYINNPEKTKAAFIDPPSWMPKDRSVSKLYRLGDLVRYLPDGKVHYFGRRDTQVKLRGQRVELGEIEHQLRQKMLGITEIAVEMVRPSEGKAPPMLIAFLGVVPTEECGKASNIFPEIATSTGDLERYSAAVEGIFEKLADILPRHMIPSAYLPLRMMPFTASAKTDRGKLQQLARSLSVEQLSNFTSITTRPIIAPATDMERTLHAIWVKVLNIPEETIGREENFFRLGGDSISAMRLVAMVRFANLDLTVESIFKNPILYSMALSMKSLRTETKQILPFELVDEINTLRREASIACQVSESDIEDVYPVTAMQEGLIALAQKENGSYMAQFGFSIPDHIDVARLRAAWDTTYQQVPILRTRLFQTTNHGMMQAVVKSKILWRGGSDKARYLVDDRQLGMRLGQPLSRFAIVEDRVLIFSAHHAVYDGWSVQPIYRRVEEIYHGLNTKPPIHFNRFIKYVTSMDRVASEDFWRKQLDKAPPSIFPSQLSNRVFEDASISRNVKFAKREGSGVTGATLIRTALAIILGMYSDTDDVVFGATQSGRAAPLSDIHDIAGPTLATTPVRVTFSSEMEVADLLQRVQDQSFDIIQHEQMGLQNIRRVSPDAETACDFKSLLVIQNHDDDVNKSHATFLGCTTANKDFFQPFHTYPFVLQCTFNPQGYTLDLNFDAVALPTARAERLLGHFTHIVQQLDLERPDCRVKDIDIMIAEDFADLKRFNKQAVEPVEICLHHLVGKVVQQQPTASAIAAWDGNLTYRELDDFSSLLASELVTNGVTVGSVIPICFEKSRWAVVTMLAILKAGAAYCPLDRHHPKDRLLEIVGDLSAGLILTSTSNVTLFEGFPCRVLEVSLKSVTELSQQPLNTDLQLVHVTPDNTAYCFFTSGSSGKPKGVLTSHRAISTSVSQHSAFGLHAKSRMLQFSAFTFDISIVEVFSTLANGACVCMPSEVQRLEGIVEAMNEMAVTIAILTPSFAKVVKPAQLPYLQQLILGAEPIRKDLIQDWAEKVRLLNAYGVTEASVCNMIAEVDSPEFSEQCIGAAVGSLSWIIDPNDHDRLMPVGLTGELAIEGPILSDGYLHDAEKTAAAFVENPAFMTSFPIQGQATQKRRLYKTGDLVKYKPSGLIDFIGRKDNQTKLNGIRIELEEIEYQVRRALDGQPDVAVEVVTPGGRADNPTIALFLGYPTSEAARVDSTESLLCRITTDLTNKVSRLDMGLRKSLPAYMIPTSCFFLKAMPLLTSGKIDRKSLRKLAFDNECETTLQKLSLESQFEPPTTETELILQRVWAQVLSLDPNTIGKHSSFFRLGGDSLSAVKAIAVARTQKIGLTVASMFEHPTLEEMAIRATISTAATTEPPLPFSLVRSGNVGTLLQEASKQAAIPIHEIEDLYPTTPLQEGMMVTSLQDVGTYSAHFAYRLSPTLDKSNFRQAWAQVIANCQIMRTRIIHSTEAGFIQVVSKKPTEIQRIQSTDLEAYKASTGVMGLGTPLYVLAMLGEDQQDETADQWFVLTMHHAGYDGWSLGNIWRNVQEAYYGIAQSPVLGINNLIRYLGQKSEESNLGFWKTYLDGSKPASFPTLPNADYRSVADSELNGRVKFTKPFQSDATAATLLQAAWGLLLTLYESSQDVTFGVVASGRTTPLDGIEDVVGSAVSNFPFRVQLHAEDTISQYLDRVRRSGTEVMPFQQFGFQNIRKASSDAKAATALRTLLVFQGVGNSSLDLYAERLGVTPEPVKVAGMYTFPITLTCTLESTDMSVHVSYDSKVVSGGTVNKLLGQFEHIIDQLVTLPSAAPNMTIREMNLTSPADVAQIHDWHQLQTVCANEKTTIHDMFRHQAIVRPDAPAVSSWDGELTYHEVDDYSDRLAQVLVDLGVGVDDFVGFCFEKSIWSVVSILATLKAGGVWSPLNPDHPRARLDSLLQRMSAGLCLTTPTHAHLFAESPTKVLEITNEFIRSLPPATSSLSHVTVTPTNAAWITFTSGSTGDPKGVVTEHRHACSGLPAQASIQGMNSESRMLQFAAFTWDLSAGELLGCLLSGGCVCMPSDHDRVNGLAGAIKALRVNQAHLTPTVARLLDPTKTFLKTLALSGEVPPQDLINAWADHTTVLNIYGPTECTVDCAGRSGLRPGISPANIGYGLNCRLWIADSHNHDRLMPVGTAGEIFVDGPIVSRGYFKDPVSTSKAFIKSPHWALAFDRTPRRLYATGDLGLYESDGTIRVLGRVDAQVKLNGQRVDLLEVDHQLQQVLPLNASFITEIITLRGRGKPLLTVFVSLPGMDSGVDDVRLLQSPIDRKRLETTVAGIDTKLATVLPEFMIPHLFLPVSKIPVSANHKIDRKPLRNLCTDVSMEELTALAVAPGTANMREPATEKGQELRKLWAKVLGIAATSISAEHSFARLGGDSMAAVKLVSLARASGYQLTVASILQHQVLDNMATAMREINADDTAIIPPFALINDGDVGFLQTEVAVKCGITIESIEDIYPAAPSQIGYLQISSKRPGLSSLLTVFELPTTVDVDRLKNAWVHLVSAHSMLRTRIVKTDADRWVQVVLRKGQPTWRSAGSVSEYYDMERNEPITEGVPLVRAGFVLDKASGKQYFCTTACHSTYDAWAYALLFAGLEKSYAEQPDLEVVPYNRFVRYLENRDMRASDDFWREEFEGYTAPPLLAGTNSEQVEANTVGDLQIQLPATQLRAKVSMPIAIYASWGLALSQTTGASDVTIQLTLSGRNAPVAEVERIMGPVLATVPLRIKIDSGKSAHWFLTNLESQCRRIIAHEHSGLERIRTLSPSTRAAIDTSFGLTVNPYQHHLAGLGSGIGLVRPLRIAMAPSPSPFYLDCAITETGVDAFALFDDRVIDRSRVREFFAHFESNLRQLTTGDGETIIKDFLEKDAITMAAEGGSAISMASIGLGLTYDPLTKQSIDVRTAFSRDGLLENGFEALDSKFGMRRVENSEHAQFMK